MKSVWAQFSDQYKEEVHLYQTLTDQPIECQGSSVTITVENSVQFDQIRLLKPEITGFLRRNLENSHIEINIKQEKAKIEKMIYTTGQKLEKMIEKNPELAEFRSLFQLDSTN